MKPINEIIVKHKTYKLSSITLFFIETLIFIAICLLSFFNDKYNDDINTNELIYLVFNLLFYIVLVSAGVYLIFSSNLTSLNLFLIINSIIALVILLITIVSLFKNTQDIRENAYNFYISILILRVILFLVKSFTCIILIEYIKLTGILTSRLQNADKLLDDNNNHNDNNAFYCNEDDENRDIRYNMQNFRTSNLKKLDKSKISHNTKDGSEFSNDVLSEDDCNFNRNFNANTGFKQSTSKINNSNFNRRASALNNINHINLNIYYNTSENNNNNNNNFFNTKKKQSNNNSNIIDHNSILDSPFINPNYTNTNSNNINNNSMYITNLTLGGDYEEEAKDIVDSLKNNELSNAKYTLGFNCIGEESLNSRRFSTPKKQNYSIDDNNYTLRRRFSSDNIGIEKSKSRNISENNISDSLSKNNNELNDSNMYNLKRNKNKGYNIDIFLNRNSNDINNNYNVSSNTCFNESSDKTSKKNSNISNIFSDNEIGNENDNVEFV